MGVIQNTSCKRFRGPSDIKVFKTIGQDTAATHVGGRLKSAAIRTYKKLYLRGQASSRPLTSGSLVKLRRSEGISVMLSEDSFHTSDRCLV